MKTSSHKTHPGRISIEELSINQNQRHEKDYHMQLGHFHLLLFKLGIFERKVGIFTSDVLRFLDEHHADVKFTVLTYLCAYVFIDSKKRRILHHRYLDPFSLENILYKQVDLMNFFHNA